MKNRPTTYKTSFDKRSTYSKWMTGITTLKALGCALAMLRQKAPSTSS